MDIVNFTKMHGCGNDFIIVDCLNGFIGSMSEISAQMSDRHFGIGADGVIMICRSGIADAQMRIFNSDGSEGMMCGNGIRCMARYMFDNGIVTKHNISVETLSGIEVVSILDTGLVMVKMPRESSILPYTLGDVQGTMLSVGTPHCVIWVDSVDELNLKGTMYDLIERDALLGRVNVEFVQSKGAELRVKVWERGCGETLSCGTGACAVAIDAVNRGIKKVDTNIKLDLVGGQLIVKCTEDAVYLTGNAEYTFIGKYKIKKFA